MKALFVFFTAILFQRSSYAQQSLANQVRREYYPDLSTFIIDSSGLTRFDYSCAPMAVFGKCNDRRKHLKMETPPWVLGVRNQTRYCYTTDGSSSYVSAIDQNIIQQPVLDFSRGAAPVKIAQNAGCLKPISPNGLLAGQDWRRSYYNVYTAQNLTHAAEGPLTIGFLDAENKATCTSKNKICPSTVTPYKSTYVQPYGCPFNLDFWPTMAGFVCAAWVYNNAATDYGQHYFDHDMGPITWPGNGYVSRAGNRTGHGVGLPSSIVYNGYVYVFYHDDGPMELENEPRVPAEDGRGEGIKVVRALINDCLDPHAWRAYYKDTNDVVHWNPSLPAGFDKDHLDVFWSEKGPQATDLMNDAGNQYEQKRFSVARAVNSGTPLFIGVEESVNNKTGVWEVSLRLSRDLLNWSPRQLVIDTGADWTGIALNYPVFCDAEGSSNTEIDLNNFYILGKGAENNLTNSFNKYHIYKVVRPASRK